MKSKASTASSASLLGRSLLVLALLLASLVYCGNNAVGVSCQRDCNENFDSCLLTGALYGTTPAGDRVDYYSVLYLGCTSARNVCQDSCGGAIGRL